MSIDIDYPAFCRLLRVRNKVGNVVPFVPTPNQRARAEMRTSRDLVLKQKQTGATTEELARDVWHFLTHPGARVVIALTLTEEYGAIAEAAAAIEVLGDALPAELMSGCTRESLSVWRRGDAVMQIIYGDTVRGRSKCRASTITRLHAHEAAWWDDNGSALHELMVQVPADGEIAVQSTPGPGAGFNSILDQARSGLSSFRLIELPIRLPAQPDPYWPNPWPNRTADAASA